MVRNPEAQLNRGIGLGKIVRVVLTTASQRGIPDQAPANLLTSAESAAYDMISRLKTRTDRAMEQTVPTRDASAGCQRESRMA